MSNAQAEMFQNAAPRRRWRWWWFLPLLLLLPHLLVNAALNLVVPSLLNKRPHKLQVRFTTAWMLVPWELHVQDVQVRGQGDKVQWWLQLGDATADVDVWKLQDRVFHVKNVHTSRGLFRYRAVRTAPLAPGEVDVTAPIEGLANPPPKGQDLAARGQRWDILVDDLTVDRLDELWFEGWKFTDQGSLKGSVALEGDFARASVDLRLVDGELGHNTEPWVRDLRGRFQADLAPIPRSEAMDRTTLERIEARTTIDGALDKLDVFEFYLENTPWLGIRGAATLHGEGGLSLGQLREGTELTANASELDVRFRAYEIRGPAEVKWTAEQSDEALKTALGVQFTTFDVRELGRPPVVRGNGFKVRATSRAGALYETPDNIDVTLDLPKSDLLDLQEFTSLLPDGFGMTVQGGEGTVEGSMDARENGHKTNGAMTVVVQNLAAKVDDTRIKTNLAANAVLHQGDLRDGVYDFRGSNVSLTRFSMQPKGGSHDRSWWARVDATRGKATVGANTYLDTTLYVSTKNTAPFVQFAASQRKMPPWFQKMLQAEGVRGSGRLKLSTDNVSLDRFELNAGKRAQLKMRLRRRDKITKGSVLTRYGAFSVGIDLQPGDVRVFLVRANKWFAKQRLPP